MSRETKFAGGRAGAVLALGLTIAAWGEESRAQAVEGEAVVYEAGYFIRFTPQTAYDIVQVVPGFALEEMTTARGLGASSGNVLIDGKRPTAKSGGLKEVLSRIPAATVARVEVSRGVTGGAEAGGQSLLVNIVRARAGDRGSWQVQAEKPNTPNLNLGGEASLAHRIGGWDTNTKVQGQWRRRNYTYYHRYTFGADGVLRQRQEEDAPSRLGEAFISTEAKRPLGGGALTLTARAGHDVSLRDRNRVNYASVSPEAPPLSRQFIGDDISRLLGEAGAEWVRPNLDGWTLKLVGLGSWTDSKEEQESEDGPFGGPVQQTSTFVNDETAVEAIGRVSLTRPSPRLTPEVGIEVAFNQLDSVVTSDQERGGLAVPGAASREYTVVEEARAEAFANAKWAASPRLKVEGGLAVEVSEISVSGDRENRQSFVFFKPTLSASYGFRDGIQARATLQRRVGQLDFTDFAASASLSDGRVLAGNAELRPEQSWRASAGLDMRSKTRGALNLEVFYELADDVLEQAILNEDGDIGLANQGSARRWGVNARGTLPLTWALPGSRLEVNLNWKDSRFEDPLTGETRTLTYFTPLTGNVGFRQDLQASKVAWGVKALLREQDKWYFVDEQSFRYRGVQYSAFLETTRFLGLKARLDVENIGGRRNGDIREFFRPDRRAPLQSYQVSRRADGEWVRLTLSRQF